MENKDYVIRLGDGRKLGYCEYGDPKGKPMFYFHGWPASRLSGKETDKAAKFLGIRVISPDRPGFGISDFQEKRTLLGWADDMTELADRLKIKMFTVMGVSGGGPFVAACAYKIPQRITKAAIVVGLAPPYIKGLVDRLPIGSKFGWRHYRDMPWVRIASAWMTKMMFVNLPFIGKKWGFGANEDKNILKHNTGEDLLGTIREAYRQGIKGPEAELKVSTENWKFDLKDIKTKIYLWYGAKDKNIPLEMGKYYYSQIPNSELFIDPGGGHLGRYEFEEKILEKLI